MGDYKRLLKLTFFIGAVICLPIFFGSNQAIGSVEENEEIRRLNKQIQEKKDRLKEIQEKQEEYALAIRKKQNEKASLKNQLSILDNNLSKLELIIETTETEIERTELEIKKTNTQIEEKTSEIEKEKSQIASALKLIYKQDRASTLEILFLNNSLSEFLNQAKYLEDINKEISNSLASLKRYREELEKEKIILEEKYKEAIKLKEELESQKITLAGEKENKAYILTQTNSSEQQYQRLLAQAKQEQQQASNDIYSIEKTVREKMSQISDRKLEFNDSGFIWPVSKNKITAYFHDPDYPFKYIFEHPAIDIRAAQATPIRAAASGYIGRAKNAGMGYSYIMLIHGNNLSTVYGHVSKIFVSDEEYVTQGQIIGLVGGLPGTPGAGRLTTGPHLHFEVRSNGIPVDPLNYLH